MKYLFGDWEIVQNRIYRAQPLYLFLDYDGTLTPIVARPELALCPPRGKSPFREITRAPECLGGDHQRSLPGRYSC
jgi:trehalose-6-phosphatase